MVLRLEQGIEVPERGEDEVPLDFGEAHAEEDSTDALDVGAEDVPLPRSDQRRERLRVIASEVDAPPFAGSKEVRGRLGDLFGQFNSGGEDFLPRRGQRNLASDGFALLHELAARFQIAHETRIDRILRQLSFCQAREEDFIGPFRVRGRAPFGGDDHETAGRPFGDLRPAFSA